MQQRSARTVIVAAGLAAGLLAPAHEARAQEKLHFTYLWHLEQPIYWPDQQPSGADRYETAWTSIQRKDGGAAHPSNNLRDIFGLDDRKAVYQWRVKDSIDAFDQFPESGAQVSYSGGLLENVSSLGNAGQLGYSSTWYSSLRTARAWRTGPGQQNKPRLDIVIFPFHHPLLPLIDESAARKEIQLYQAAYAGAWGTGAPVSRGLFPPEMAFSTRLIKVLDQEGIDWVIVSAEKISRACENFPVVFGSGGVNCDPPNKADQLNPAQPNYYRQSISRGCGPAEAYPFALTPRRARHIDPDTGVAHEVIVVPASQSLSWKDGYAPLGLSDFNALNAQNNPSRPMLVVLAHDGDNAWGGGFSYYMEATPQLVAQAHAAGYVPTVVEEYLADHPVPANDVVHVEDGAWVNADGDFGAPQFLNWNWPPVRADGSVDIENGWAEDIRNWAVITAGQNYVDTAEQITLSTGGSVNIQKILNPDAATNRAERAWHYFLGALNSGYMYYGTAEDFEVKPSVACNEAIEHASVAIGAGTLDQTGPSVWIPQRWPWNPGSVNFGPAHAYRQVVNDGDFWVWTFVHDVAGVQSVTLKYRLDADGANPLASTQNETYAGGPEVGPWQNLPMTRRVFPAGNIYNAPTIDFFEMPAAIADQYHAKILGVREKLVDYYVEAVDLRGNVRRSPIQHVWVGNGQGATGGTGDAVTLTPAQPTAGASVQVQYNPSGRNLAGRPQVNIHYGYNQWNPVISPDPAMTWDAIDQRWEITLDLPSTATQLDMVFNDGAGLWDNNGGQDWHFAVQGGAPQDTWDLDGVRDSESVLLAQNNGVSLWAGVKGTTLYVATQDAGEGQDHFVLLADTPGPLTNAFWAKGGQVAGWDAFLADENDNDFEGWFNAAGALGGPGSPQAATGANGGVLEGTIDLAGLFGAVPQTIRLAAVRYANADAGALVSSQQAPPSVNANGNVDAAEYLAVDVCALTDAGCCPADVNGDTTLDAFDFNAFVDAFNAGDTGAADFNADTTLDAFDFNAFVDSFNAGCP